jgi:hypothetical protein
MAHVKVYPRKDFAQTPKGRPGSRISWIGRDGAEGNAVGCCRRHGGRVVPKARKVGWPGRVRKHRPGRVATRSSAIRFLNMKTLGS